MQAILITTEDFKNDYPEECSLLASALDVEHLSIFYHEDMLFAYPKAEYIFQLGNWSAFYDKYNKRWLKGLGE